MKVTEVLDLAEHMLYLKPVPVPWPCSRGLKS